MARYDTLAVLHLIGGPDPRSFLSTLLPPRTLRKTSIVLFATGAYKSHLEAIENQLQRLFWCTRTPRLSTLPIFSIPAYSSTMTWFKASYGSSGLEESGLQSQEWPEWVSPTMMKRPKYG